MSRNLVCPHCKSEDVIQTLSNFRTVKFWIFQFRFPQLKQRVCCKCKTWAHELINGKSPEHIKEEFRKFEIPTQVKEENNLIPITNGIPKAVSPEALDSLFGLKALEADEKRFGKLAGGCF